MKNDDILPDELHNTDNHALISACLTRWPNMAQYAEMARVGGMAWCPVCGVSYESGDVVMVTVFDKHTDARPALLTDDAAGVEERIIE